MLIQVRPSLHPPPLKGPPPDQPLLYGGAPGLGAAEAELRVVVGWAITVVDDPVSAFQTPAKKGSAAIVTNPPMPTSTLSRRPNLLVSREALFIVSTCVCRFPGASPVPVDAPNAESLACDLNLRTTSVD
jgi:hypothetical protein